MNVREQLLKKITEMEKELALMRMLIEQENMGDSSAKISLSMWDSAVEGIPEKLDGRVFLIEGLTYMSKHGEVSVREIQEAVAEKNKKSFDTVNRSLRYAIDYAWKNQVPAISPFEKKPSVSDFLKYWYKKL